MALFKSLVQHVIQIDEETQRQVIIELGEMAIKRDKALQQDSAIVQNFWDTYEQIETHKSLNEDTVLNHHSKRHKYIAINFAHLYKVAADLRFNLPEVQGASGRATSKHALQIFRFKQDGGQQDPEREVRSLLVV